MTRLRRVLAITAALVAITTSCAAPTATPMTSPASSGQTEAEPSTYDRLFERMGPDGEVDLQLALDAFAVAIAPIPGAQPVTGAAPEPHEVKSGTFAVRWIMNHYSELSAEQKAAVDSALEPGPEAVTVMPEETGRVASLSSAGLSLDGAQAAAEPVAAVLDTHEAYVAIAKEAVTLIAQRLGRRLSVPYYVWLNDTMDGKSLAYTRPYQFPGIGPLGCGIHVQPVLRSGKDDSDIRTTMAHEMFHCFQSVIIGFRAFWEQKEPSWIIEGQAEFAGELVMGPSATVGLGWWNKYIQTPHQTLVGRTYDATGFYWRLQELGFDPMAHMDAMLRELFNAEEAFKAAGAASDDFLYSWASSFHREQNWGIAWDAEPIWSTAAKATPTPAIVTVNSSVPVLAPNWTTDVYAVDTSVEIVEVRIKGFARLHMPDGDILDLDQLWLCTNGECKCPEGQRFTGPNLVPAFGNFHVALTGGLDGTSGTLTGHELKEFCEPMESPRPDDCSAGCGRSIGDVHIVTINDREYDFQAAGEFVLLRSADGTFEVQSRIEPYKDEDDISINTAIAFRAGSHRVGMYVDSEFEEVAVRLDGTPVDLTSPLEVEGATVRHVGVDTIEVTFADGTTLVALGSSEYGINVSLNPSAALRAGAVGLIGPVPAGNNLGLPALPDGTVLPNSLDLEEIQRGVYDTFADAWRITPEGSLFDYGPGLTSDSYQRLDFPVLDDLITFEELTPEQRAAGEAACARITIQFLHDMCVYDVGVTGVQGFGDFYDLTATVVEGSGTGTGMRVRVVNLYADENGPVPLDVYAWSTIQEASRVTTVPYGTASEYFDPGPINEFGTGDAIRMSMTRQGETLNEWAFNAVDTGSVDVVPGAAYTYLIVPGEENPFSTANPPARYALLREVEPVDFSFPLPEPPAGQALVFFDLAGTEETVPGLEFYVGDGNNCLKTPGFDTLAWRVKLRFESPASLLLEPGSHSLTLHRPEVVDDFTFKCDSPSLYGPIDVEVEAGDRILVFMYATPTDVTLQHLILPIGD